MEDWNARKARLKEKFATLSPRILKDKEEQLITRLERRLGVSRETVMKLLSEL